MADRPGKKTGRPTGKRPKCTEDLMARIAGQIKKGNHIKTACVASGVGVATFYEWKARGEQDRTGKPATDDSPAVAPKRTIYVQFLETIEHADAVAQQRLVSNVIQKGGWKGSMEILKRRWPKEFGDKTALSNADGTPLSLGGPPINVTVKCDAPADDDPWLPDPNATEEPAADGEQPEPPTTDAT